MRYILKGVDVYIKMPFWLSETDLKCVDRVMLAIILNEADFQDCVTTRSLIRLSNHVVSRFLPTVRSRNAVLRLVELEYVRRLKPERNTHGKGHCRVFSLPTDTLRRFISETRFWALYEGSNESIEISALRYFIDHNNSSGKFKKRYTRAQLAQQIGVSMCTLSSLMKTVAATNR